jgi:holo-[acyl-carrier protein] synthase
VIVGIGVDTVDIARFSRQLERTPALLQRLFVPAERDLPLHSLAARFAAREALIKALGGSGELTWHDMAVERGNSRVPRFVETEKLRSELACKNVSKVHLSMTHDAGVATAFVVVEADTLDAEHETG